MQLTNAKEINQFAILIIQYFHLGGRLMEENLGTASKGLDIAKVRLQESDDYSCQQALAADLGYGAMHRFLLLRDFSRAFLQARKICTRRIMGQLGGS